MKTIGIDQNNYLIYEGNGAWGHGLWPSPSILPAHVLSFDGEPALEDRTYLQRQPYIFIDEGYDPVSRVRKGRVFEKTESSPSEWNVTPHPALNEEVPSNNKTLQKSLVTFREFNFSAKMQREGIAIPHILLGTKNHYTIWSVIDIETTISGETILFIKARKVIGSLPKINYTRIENTGDQKAIEEKIRLLSQDISCAAPDSVVDRCRESASAIINAYLAANGHLDKARELGQLEKPLRELAEKHIVANLASVLAKLHSRTKHVEQSNRKIRTVSEQDAEFSVQAIGVILVELGWGYW